MSRSLLYTPSHQMPYSLGRPLELSEESMSKIREVFAKIGSPSYPSVSTESAKPAPKAAGKRKPEQVGDVEWKTELSSVTLRTLNDGEQILLNVDFANLPMKLHAYGETIGNAIAIDNLRLAHVKMKVNIELQKLKNITFYSVHGCYAFEGDGDTLIDAMERTCANIRRAAQKLGYTGTWGDA